MSMDDAHVMHDHFPWKSTAWLEKNILQYFD